MKELFVTAEQIRQPERVYTSKSLGVQAIQPPRLVKGENHSAPGDRQDLTPEARASYAGKGSTIYMAEGNMDGGNQQTNTQTQTTAVQPAGLEHAAEVSPQKPLAEAMGFTAEQQRSLRLEWEAYAGRPEKVDYVPKTHKKIDREDSKEVNDFDDLIEIGVTPEDYERLQPKPAAELRRDWNEFRKNTGDENIRAMPDSDINQLIKMGVTPEQFQGNRILFEKKLHPEKIKRLRQAWIARFNHSDEGRAEYRRKLPFINTLIAQGIWPEDFEANYNWSAFFDPKADKGRTKKESVIKKLFKAVVSGVLELERQDEVKEEEKDPAGYQVKAKERKQSFARVLWGALNIRKEEEAKAENRVFVLGMDERSAQEKAIELGAEPERRKYTSIAGVRTEDGRSAVNPLEVIATSKLSREERLAAVIDRIKSYLPGDIRDNFNLTEAQADEFMRIHKIGGIYNLSLGQAREKYKDLQTWLADIGVNEVYRKGLTRQLMEAGLAGGPGEPGNQTPEGEPQRSDPWEQYNEYFRSREYKEYFSKLPPEKQAKELQWNQWLEEEHNAGREFSAKEITKAMMDKEVGISPEDSVLSKDPDAYKEQDPNRMTPQQRNKANEIVQMFIEQGFSVDLNDPAIANMVIRYAKMPGNITPVQVAAMAKAITASASAQQMAEKQVQEVTPELQEEAGRAWENWLLKEDQEGRHHRGDAEKMRRIEEWRKIGKKPDDKGVMQENTGREEPPDINDPVNILTPEPDWEGKGLPSAREEALRIPEQQKTLWERLQDTYAANKDKARLDMEQVALDLFDREIPSSVQDLAWQIGMSAPDMYGVLGEHPVWEVVYKDGGRRLKKEDMKDLYNSELTVGRVNRANFIRWLRDRMTYMHGDTPDDPIDFETAISIDKPYRPVYFKEARTNPGKYFRDVENIRERRRLQAQLLNAPDDQKQVIRDQIESLPVLMEDLLDEFKRETWDFGDTRTRDLHYRARSGDKQEFVKMMAELNQRSSFTKTVWEGRSLFDWAFTMDQNYGTKDHKVGAGIVTAYLTYYNLTDTKKLREILGPDSSLLTKAGLKRSRDIAAGILNINGDRQREYRGKADTELDGVRNAYFSDKTIEGMFEYSHSQLYDKDKGMKRIYEDIGLASEFNSRKFEPVMVNGVQKVNKDGEKVWREVDAQGNEVINEWAFIDSMNVFKSPQFNAKTEHVLHTAIQADIAKKCGLYMSTGENGNQGVDDLNTKFAEMFAFQMTRWTGAQARNNQSAAGYDAWVSLMKTRTYRMKYGEADRSEATGNPYTIHELRSLNTDMMTAIRTETKISKDDLDPAKNPLASKYMGQGEGANKTPLAIMEEMLAAWNTKGLSDKEKSELFIEKSKQLLFPGNTLKYFVFDHVARGMEIYDQVMKAEEIRLEKFTRIDMFKGVTFERDQFQAAVQDKFLKPMRYLLSTWNQTDFAQTVRSNRGHENNTGWKDISLAEDMFGREMLDIPEFWERVDPGTPGAKKYHLRNKNMEWEDSWRMPNQISGKEVNNNRPQLIKQMAKTRIAAELYAHVDLHSNDPRYDFRYYETIYQALESLAGGVEGDETDLKSAKTILDPNRRYFTKEDILWIRKKSNTTQGRLYGMALLKAILWDGLIKGGMQGAGIFMKATVAEQAKAVP